MSSYSSMASKFFTKTHSKKSVFHLEALYINVKKTKLISDISTTVLHVHQDMAQLTKRPIEHVSGVTTIIFIALLSEKSLPPWALFSNLWVIIPLILFWAHKRSCIFKSFVKRLCFLAYVIHASKQNTCFSFSRELYWLYICDQPCISPAHCNTLPYQQI